ncbi:MAG: serine/threonine-protein kinase [Chloroflexi bacterium]|nr:serine/threonine-protein kinase [Chloroflexota bacterium]
MTQPSLPSSIGRYEIKGELGRGGMATVFHGFDPQVKRDVAIKILPPEFLHDPSFRARFEREVQTIALLEHPAIVPLYDFGEDKGQLYFVMRIMSGGSLADKLEHGPLSLEETASILARLAPALDEAHARGIVHRDLKPGNILFDQRGSPYVSDFGIAKIATGGGGTYTGTGLIGTPAYMSPEQARGEKEIDGRSDIYSLGGIVFEMLAGRLPYESDTAMGVIVKHITDPVPQILSANPNLPPAIETVIAQAMAKERQDRFATARDLALALSAVARGEVVTAPPASVTATMVHSGPLPAAIIQTQPMAPPTPQRKVPAWLFLVGGLVVVGILAGALFGSGILGSRGQTSVAPTAAVSGEQLTTTAAAIEAASLAQRTATAGAAQTETTDLQATNEALALVSQATGTALAQAGATAAAEATVGAQTTATAQAAGDQQALVSEPKLAFVNESDIWVVNPVDGSHLRQVTFDGGEKRSLRWLPDGQTIGFISGRCILTTNIFTSEDHGLGCFNSSDFLEGFDVSSDGKLIAVSVDRLTFITEFNPEVLEPITSRAELGRIATCVSDSASGTRYIRMSRDGTRIAVVAIAQQAGRAVEAVKLLGFKCGSNFLDLKDLFPGSRFTMANYEVHPSIETFGWNGESLFALIDVVRNGGFGDLYVYNSDTFRRPVKLNPVLTSACCYRDPQWSADGTKFAFAFQDILKGADSRTELYYMDYGTINTGKTYTPIPLPADFLSDPRESPQPVIAPPYQPTP